MPQEMLLLGVHVNINPEIYNCHILGTRTKSELVILHAKREHTSIIAKPEYNTHPSG